MTRPLYAIPEGIVEELWQECGWSGGSHGLILDRGSWHRDGMDNQLSFVKGGNGW